jgi:CSLREA domain-containing protein
MSHDSFVCGSRSVVRFPGCFPTSFVNLAIRTAFFLVIASFGLTTMISGAGAATITVNTLTDESTPSDGLCSLREAINNANAKGDTTGGDCTAGTGTDRIVFSLSGTLTLILGTQNGDLPTVGTAGPNSITTNLSIDGVGQTVIIDGGGIFNPFTVDPGSTLVLNNLTIQHSAPGAEDFGALSVSNSKFLNNSGGVDNTGTLTINDSTFSGNIANPGFGAAIFGAGNMTISGSTFLNNNALDGGALFNTGPIFGAITAGTMSITNCTFSGNTAGFYGGAIVNGGTMTITNSTLSGNSAPNDAGGITNGASLTISNSVLDGNTGGNCFNLTIPTFTVTLTNGGYNTSSDASCSFGSSTGANGQIIGDNVNPLLSSSGLQFNGGPTQTIALQPTSPAVNAIPVADCPATDQRGVTRPDAGEAACDIGAHELQDQPTFAGLPGSVNCNGKSLSALSNEFGTLDAAASALGFPSIKALKTAVGNFCAR